MGLAKTEWMESQERGWDAPDKYVCAECLEDEYLKSVVSDQASEMQCDYCGRDSQTAIAAPLSAILEPISAALLKYFAEPGAACLPRDSGEWVGEEDITDTQDALLSLPLNCDEELFEDIAGAFHNTAWYPCAKGHWLNLHRHIELRYSWQHFVSEIKHQSRFFFSNQKNQKFDNHDDDQSSISLLEEIARMLESLGLIRSLPKGTALYRVRKTKPGTTYTTFEELGPPPPELATAGRMNPAGISYFYLALDERTALAEVLEKPPVSAALAYFETKQNLNILDLAELPPIPSVFDEGKADFREHLLFLFDFIDAITEPITRNGQEHIDYVPSQVVSEYLAQVFCTRTGKLDAVVYPSAMMPSGRNIVIFPIRSYQHELSKVVELKSLEELEIHNWPELHDRLM